MKTDAELEEEREWEAAKVLPVFEYDTGEQTQQRVRFGEFLTDRMVTGNTPRVFGTQAEGCAPIVRLVERGASKVEPVIPNTIARSIAIGNPADGPYAGRVIRESGGWAAAVSDTKTRAVRRTRPRASPQLTRRASRHSPVHEKRAATGDDPSFS